VLAAGGAVKADLVTQDRLARSGRAFDDVDTSAEQATIENRVEARDASLDAIHGLAIGHARI
jgi:hypothetical protein